MQGAELASSEARASLLSGDTEEQSRWAEGKDLNDRDTLTDGYKTLPTAGHGQCHGTGLDTPAQAARLLCPAQKKGLFLF